MKALTRLIFRFLLVLVTPCSHSASTKPFSFPRGTPESQGVSSVAVLALVEALDQIDAMNSFMLVRHGHIIAEGWWTPYDAQSNHELYSLSKSFTSTAVGMAVAEGKLSIDDEVLKFFPEDAPAAPTNNLKAMRVRDLLTMSAGHQDETSRRLSSLGNEVGADVGRYLPALTDMRFFQSENPPTCPFRRRRSRFPFGPISPGPV